MGNLNTNMGLNNVVQDKAKKAPTAIGTAFKIMNVPQTIANAKANTENVVSSGINAVQNNQYHQKLSEERDEGAEKGTTKKDRHWTKYVPAAAGVLLLSATVPRIVKSGDVTKPLQDIRDGIKRVPAAIINKAKKENPAVEEVVRAVGKEAKKSGGKAIVNNSALSRFGLGLMQGTGALMPFLAGSAYLSHKAKTAPDEKSKEEAERLRKAHNSMRPATAAGIEVYNALHKTAAYDDGHEKIAIPEEVLKSYVDKRTKQYYDNAHENIRMYNRNVNRIIDRLKKRYGPDKPEAQKIVQEKIKGYRLDKQINRANELNRARSASDYVNYKVKKQKKLYEEIAKKNKAKAKENAYKTLGGKIKWNAKAGVDGVKDYFNNNKKKLAVATGVLTAGATLNTLHNKLIKPKLNGVVKDSIKKHYDKKIDNLYKKKREEDESTEKKAAAAYFDDALGTAMINTAKMPVELAWTAGSELIKQRKRLNREKNKIENRAYYSRKEDSDDRRHNGNNNRGRKNNKSFKHNVQGERR